jgi:ribonuclease P protein component
MTGTRCPMRQLAVREPTSEQAHVPAEQPPSGQDPRLPPAHADPCRPRHSRRPPGQGPLAAVGLSHVLPAASRLRRPADFTATLRRARTARADGMIVLHAAVDPVSDPPVPPRVGFVVPRAVGPAVTRNRVRRRLRHLLRARLAVLPPGTRLVVRVLPGAAAASSAALGAALDSALGSLLARLGGGAPPVTPLPVAP